MVQRQRSDLDRAHAETVRAPTRRLDEADGDERREQTMNCARREVEPLGNLRDAQLGVIEVERAEQRERVRE